MRTEHYSPMENSLIGPQLLKVAEVKAAEIRDKYSPDLAPFIDENVYGKEAVIRDLRRVIDQEKRFSSNRNPKEIEAKRLSDVFENYFVDAANTQKWFGANTQIMRTTKYDDYFNKVDAVATFEDGGSRYGHLALNADLTFGYDAMAEKIESLINDINNREMSRLRYFHSPAMGYTGQLSNIPKTVIGLDKEHLPEFVRLWTHDQENPELLTMRNIMMVQLIHQLRFFTQYADKKHGESDIRNRYAQTLRLVEDFWKKTGLTERDVPQDLLTTHIKSL